MIESNRVLTFSSSTPVKSSLVHNTPIGKYVGHVSDSPIGLYFAAPFEMGTTLDTPYAAKSNRQSDASLTDKLIVYGGA